MYGAGGSGRLVLHALNELVGFSNGAVHVFDELTDLGVDFNSYAVSSKTEHMTHHNRSRGEGEGPDRSALLVHVCMRNRRDWDRGERLD